MLQVIGQSGVGKTSFIDSLLRRYSFDGNLTSSQFLFIDCSNLVASHIGTVKLRDTHQVANGESNTAPPVAQINRVGSVNTTTEQGNDMVSKIDAVYAA